MAKRIDWIPGTNEGIVVEDPRYGKTTYPNDAEILTCTCCGRGIHDTPEENVHHGEAPYPHDAGVGACVECFGRKTARSKNKKPSTMTEPQFKRSIGWALVTFYEARFDLVRGSLSPANQAGWDKLPYWKKCAMVARCVEEGWII